VGAIVIMFVIEAFSVLHSVGKLFCILF